MSGLFNQFKGFFETPRETLERYSERAKAPNTKPLTSSEVNAYFRALEASKPQTSTRQEKQAAIAQELKSPVAYVLSFPMSESGLMGAVSRGLGKVFAPATAEVLSKAEQALKAQP